MSSAGKNLSDFSHMQVPSAKPYTFGIVVAEWNTGITGPLLEGAIDGLKKNGAEMDKIDVYPVPGSFELTAGALLLAESGKYDAVITLGCVIQGETRHFDFICAAVAHGVTEVSIKTGIPVIFGVLTTDNLEQAQDRAGGKHGNKGEEAAVTAIKMAEMKSLF
ncbi:MAG: 6,7-dimethyl-8-ribityllumazine synthase [Sphingobacteriales bacterium]|jgi:6,7-dimethyl-8-ribityllumazine synthase|nr:6,7-dimethyl-8-ribityllumazine synthase [Sphingobacteriales bacterium]